MKSHKPQPGIFKIPHLRWLIAFALFLGAVLNYIDRNVLGILAPAIQKDLAINDQQYATVINFFLLAYTVAYLLSGRIVDKLGVRLSLALFIGWWSLSNALTGLAQSMRSLAIYRFMLGLGEAGVWTAAPKAVSEWFPPAERGVAVGLYSVGGAVGATVAPLIVALIAPRFGWRWVFGISPVLALLWVVLWLWLYRTPAGHPRLTGREREYLTTHLEPAPQIQAAGESEWSRWNGLLREPLIWKLMLARLLTDPVWYFYQFWLPKYLHTARGLDQKGLSILWLVFLAGDAGFLAGGLVSGWLIKRGSTPPAARIWVMLCSACLTPLLAFMPLMPTLNAVIALGMAVAGALTFWLGSLTALVVDVVPSRILGTAFGAIACGSVVGGIFMNESVAWLIRHRSYDDCFYLLACMHPVALVLIWRVRRYRPASITP